MSKKTILLLLIVVALSLPLFSAVDKVSVGGTYAIETITPEGMTEEKIASAGLLINGSSFFSPYLDIGIKYWLGIRKITDLKRGATTVDATNAVPYVDAGVAVVYQAPITYDVFLEAGAGFQYSQQSTDVLGLTFELGTFYANAFIEASYAFNDSLFFTAGAIVGYPLYVDATIKDGTYSASAQGSATGLYLAPYAGISFAY